MPASPPAPFSAIRLYRVPDLAPPYDDDLPDEAIPALPRGPSREATGQALPGLRSEQRDTSAQATREPSARRRAGQQSERDSASSFPSQFAQVLAETLAGARPAGQLVNWTTERARSRIRNLGPVLAADQQPTGHQVQPRVCRVVTSRPAAGVVEMSVVVGFGEKVRALAVRLERTQPQPARPGRAAQPARWLCTALEAG